MMNLKICFLAGLTALASVNAHAEAYNGAYAGGVVGYDSAKISASTGGTASSISGDGVSGGLVAGYNAKLGENFMLGGEIVGVIGGGKITSGTDSLKSEYTASIGARAGFVASSRFLVFGKVAYVNSRFKADDGFSSESDSGDGVGFGGGFEYAFSDRVSARLDYLHTNYSVSQDLQANVGANVDITRDQAQVGVLFHF